MRRGKTYPRALGVFNEGLAALGWPAILILFAALLIGGGGSRYGLLNLTIQLLALALLCWFNTEARASMRSLGVGLLALVAATIALPLLQLVPLPPDIWQALPGREIAFESRDIVGAADQWFPMTLDRGRTLVAFASLVPAVAIILLVRKSGSRNGFAQAGLRLLVLFALLNLLLGGFQIATRGLSPLPYPILDASRSYGFFASHNTSGLFSVIGLCALAGVRFSDRGVVSPRTAKLVLASILAIATILTQSRSSTALLILPLAYLVFLALRDSKVSMSRKLVVQAVLGLGAILLTVGYLTAETRLAATLERFEDLEDARPDIWQDGLVSAERFFPVGAGMGAFDEVFQLDESLETISPSFARRAHNEYIEIAVEAGIFGLAIVSAWLIWGSLSWYRALGVNRSKEGAAAGLALVCIALQSFVDYPLRNQTLLCVAALLVAILARPIVQKRVR